MNRLKCFLHGLQLGKIEFIVLIVGNENLLPDGGALYPFIVGKLLFKKLDYLDFELKMLKSTG